MPIYVYKAKAGPDRTVDGELTAENQTVAVARIDAMGLSPIWVRAKDEATAQAEAIFRRLRVRRRDVSVFTRQLASLLHAGVPILRALVTIREQTENRKMQSIVAHLEENIRDGRMLSEAIRLYPAVFSELYVNMVRSGETAGVLDEILLRLAEAQDEEDELRAKVLNALAYPLLVLIVGAVSVLVMLTVFMPRIEALFRAMHQDLPLPTQILLAVSRFASESWYWIVIPVLLGGLIIRRMCEAGPGRLLWDQVLLRLPVAGRLLRDADLSRFAHTLALLIQSGIPIHRALEYSSATVRNAVLRAALVQVGKGTVDQGLTLTAGLRRLPQVPVFVMNMVAVGEESGHIEESLQEIGRYYGRELDRDIRTLTALLEPALILLVGAVAGFIIFATLLPIFRLSLGAN